MAIDANSPTMIPTGRVLPVGAMPDGAIGDMTQVKNYVIITLPSHTSLNASGSSDDPSSTLIIYDCMKKNVSSIPGLSDPSPSGGCGRNYTIQPVTGAGLGMFAAKDFLPGEIIACEYPIMVMPQAIPGNGREADAHLSRILKHMLDSMTEENRTAFLALKNCKGPENLANYGIIETNALGIGTLPGHNGQFLCVCNDISRINHSCSPNAHQFWNLESFTMVVRALRHILPGEQISISYLSKSAFTESRSRRQKELLDDYGFSCACSCCVLPEKESLQSNWRRSIIAASHADPEDETELKVWVATTAAPDHRMLARSELLIKIMQEEQCWEEEVWPAHLQRLCKAHCALENLTEARKWAELAMFLTTSFAADDQGWSDVVASPENTNWWGLRSKLTQQRASK